MPAISNIKLNSSELQTPAQYSNRLFKATYVTSFQNEPLQLEYQEGQRLKQQNTQAQVKDDFLHDGALSALANKREVQGYYSKFLEVSAYRTFCVIRL